jgi:hypothetical protein
MSLNQLDGTWHSSICILKNHYVLKCVLPYFNSSNVASHISCTKTVTRYRLQLMKIVFFFPKLSLIDLVHSGLITYHRCLEICLSFYVITMHLSLRIFGGKVSLVSRLYRLDKWGIASWYEQEIFYSPKHLDWFCALSTHLPIQWVRGGFLCD